MAALDLIFLQDCFDVIGPIIASIANLFLLLAEGSYHAGFAHADLAVYPFLRKRKSFLSSEDLSNNHPIATLSFISKILEKEVANGSSSNFSVNKLNLPSQCAYSQCHPIKTVLLGVDSHIKSIIDKGKLTALIYNSSARWLA